MANDDDKRPGLSVASEQSDAEMARREAGRELDWASDRLSWSIKHFTANLLRVMRGAGRPYEFVSLMNKVAEAYNDPIFNSTNTDRTPIIEAALQEGLPSRDDLGWRDTERARKLAMKGALQTAASRLLKQRTQIVRGESEMDEGVQSMQAAWEAQREKWRREFAAYEQKKPRRKAKPKAAPNKKQSTADFMKKRAKQLRGKK